MQNIPTMTQLQPYMPYIVMAFTGLIAGWLASSILGGSGLLHNLIVGVIGAFVGGALVHYKLLQLPAQVTQVTDMVPGGFGTQILVSTIGAALVILVARFLGRS